MQEIITEYTVCSKHLEDKLLAGIGWKCNQSCQGTMGILIRRKGKLTLVKLCPEVNPWAVVTSRQDNKHPNLELLVTAK